MTTNCFKLFRVRTKHVYKDFQSSIVYKFSGSSGSKSYNGKTDRCIHTRFYELATTDKSEIYKHINACEHFTYITSLMTLNINDYYISIEIYSSK